MHLKKSLKFFHNGSNYDYHFIINESAEESEKMLFAQDKKLIKT